MEALIIKMQSRVDRDTTEGKGSNNNCKSNKWLLRGCLKCYRITPRSVSLLEHLPVGRCQSWWSAVLLQWKNDCVSCLLNNIIILTCFLFVSVQDSPAPARIQIPGYSKSRPRLHVIGCLVKQKHD